MKPPLRHGSSMCDCPTCGLRFSATSTFDKHRQGPYDGDRRCLTPKEMRAKKMVERNGVWGMEGTRPEFLNEHKAS
jgi:hypothetical protein